MGHRITDEKFIELCFKFRRLLERQDCTYDDVKNELGVSNKLTMRVINRVICDEAYGSIQLLTNGRLIYRHKNADIYKIG